MPMSSPMMTTMLGRCGGACASAGVAASSPTAKVEASSFDRKDCRLSSPVPLIVCPIVEKGRSELLPGRAHHPLTPLCALCRFGRNGFAAKQGGERGFAEQSAIGAGKAAGLRKAMRPRDFGDARRPWIGLD